MGLFSLLAFGSCSFGETGSQQTEDTFYYSNIVSMVPDTLVRPELQWVSSYRLPVEQYGFSLAFDGNDSTYWSTAPGLNHLEGFEWRFDEPIQLGLMSIKTIQAPMFSNPERILVITDRGQIQAIPGAITGLPDSIRWLKVLFLIDRNWSRVALPLENSAFSSLMRVKKGFSTLFESKPIGIAEIQFKSSRGTHSANLNTDGFSRITEQQRASQRFDINDGRSFSGLNLNDRMQERRIFYQFPDLRPILGFRIRSESTASACLQLAWHKPNGSTVFYEVNQGNWEHIFRTDTLATKNISFTLRLMEGNQIFLTEFDFWDGAKWYRLQEDSMQTKLGIKLKSETTPSQWPLNFSISFDEGFAPKIDGASEWETERDALRMPNISKKVFALFRANGLFELIWNSESETDTNRAFAVFSGNWNWEEGKLKLDGMIWNAEGVFKQKAEYLLKGTRLIPETGELPEFEFTY